MSDRLPEQPAAARQLSGQSGPRLTRHTARWPPPSGAAPVSGTAATAIAVPSAAGDTSAFEVTWNPIDLGASRTFGCTVRSRTRQPLVVTIEQGLYRRDWSGDEAVTIAALPVAAPGAVGTLTIREAAGSARCAFTWTWQALTSAHDATRESRLARLLGRLGLRSQQAASAGVLKPAIGNLQSGPARATPFDGEWIKPGRVMVYGMRITGDIGIATITNAPDVYKPGDTILHIDSRNDREFRGRLIYTDGAFRSVHAILATPDQLDFVADKGQGGHYETQGSLVRRS